MTTSLPGQDNAVANAKPSASENATKRPIWEIVAEIGAQIPDEEWTTVPSDASINYKHYLYDQLSKNS
ncbi:hypothetical protein C7B65_00070 [Phormidesmis priestleyi ULC007]|uniref:Uncharacterized protein n=1 Tax=Phormidesmis priestleyi ULC007 TaxID=1920490 RepID=A0A2T1DN18_9CYAN|nr:hypothetical protein [Phormidesmis priestleyi]PSB21861.1 hypothetical protein C7B65_00070 [Phormidesmis priestleyi ULC007]PZO50517.1 MAG: hypothetical protein DCF14_11360 [Phormidesmis priestleyi]